MTLMILVEKVEKENVEKTGKKSKKGKCRNKKRAERKISKKSQKVNVKMINIFLVIYDKYYALLIFRKKRQEKVYTKIKFYFFFLSN